MQYSSEYNSTRKLLDTAVNALAPCNSSYGSSRRCRLGRLSPDQHSRRDARAGYARVGWRVTTRYQVRRVQGIQGVSTGRQCEQVGQGGKGRSRTARTQGERGAVPRQSSGAASLGRREPPGARRRDRRSKDTRRSSEGRTSRRGATGSTTAAKAS